MQLKIAPDKKKHFFVGIPLGVLVQLLSVYLLPASSFYATAVAVFVLVIICYGFELFSKATGKGHADHLDALAGILGGIIGIAFICSIYLIS